MFSRFIHLIAWIHGTFLYSFLWLNTNLHISVCICAQSPPNLCYPMDCNPPRSSVHGTVLARILEWVAISSFRGSSQSSDQNWVALLLSGRFFTTEPPQWSPYINRYVTIVLFTHQLMGILDYYFLAIRENCCLWTSMLLCGHPIWASLVAQLVKNLPGMQETPVEFLGQEDSLEKR